MNLIDKILVILSFLHVIGALVFQFSNQTDLAALHMGWAVFTYLIARET